MRPIALFLLLLPLLLAFPWAAAAEDKKDGGKAKKPPPPPGIRFERDFEQGMARAERTGLPILFAVNALENESANNNLATQLYRSKAWGDASRGYVAFVCNPNEHGTGTKNSCRRYPGCDCGAHRLALQWFLARFGTDLISPQHVIFEPDGDVAYRKEYFTFEVGPRLLDTYLSNIAPKAAYGRAGIGREKKIKELAIWPAEELDAAVAKWLDGSDGLAAAGVLNVLDEATDGKRRLALIHALRHTPSKQAPVLLLAAEERVLYPEDEPEETMAWLRTLFEADRGYGVWAATRLLVRMPKELTRDAVLRVWSGRPDISRQPSIDDLPVGERSAAYEALILAGDERGRRRDVPASWTRGRKYEVLRARAAGGSTTVPGTDVEKAVAEATPRDLRRLLLAADRSDIKSSVDAVIGVLASSPYYRVRVAAALRLLDIGNPQGGAVVKLVLEALGDPIEAEETRANAVRILGEDPGQDPAEWRRVMESRVKGGGK